VHAVAERTGSSRAYSPDLDALTTALTSVLARSPLACARVRVVGRSPIVHGSFPSEIVRCQCDDRPELQLFCKYGVGHTISGHGHRGGVRREAAVYRRVLPHTGQSVPVFYGAYTEPKSGATWLIIEHLEGSSRLNHSFHPDAMSLGAQWIGRFHADAAARCAIPSMGFLPRYDAEYYRGWARRTLEEANGLRPTYPWLATMCERFEDLIDVLLTQPQTIIHGEYYPKNVLVRQGTVYPVDWESAAVAAGEIDLASMTDRWPADVVREAEGAYVGARWPDGPPALFRRKLDAARLYVQFRWLGDPATQQVQAWRFEELRSVGQRLALI